jgi:hypothetical protein
MTSPRVRSVLPFGLLVGVLMTVPIVKLLQALGVHGPSFYGWFLLHIAGAAALAMVVYLFLLRWRSLLRVARRWDRLWEEEWRS